MLVRGEQRCACHDIGQFAQWVEALVIDWAIEAIRCDRHVHHETPPRTDERVVLGIAQQVGDQMMRTSLVRVLPHHDPRCSHDLVEGIGGRSVTALPAARRSDQTW